MAFKISEAVGLDHSLKRAAWNGSMQLLKALAKHLFNSTLQGRQNLLYDGPAIVLVKSTSGPYPLVSCVAVSEATGRKVYQQFDNEYFTVPMIRSWLQYLGAVPVTDGKMLVHDKEFLAGRLAEGGLVGLGLHHEITDPETGERATVKNLDVVELAVEAKVPIIPVIAPDIDGILDLRTGKVDLNRRVTMVALEPYEIEDGDDQVDAIHEHLSAMVAEREKAIF